ncbi:MAG: TonB family protein [Acidobacteria bacterium]|nr:MAG: TonB family protein [Acidobacteriota bacterium]
MPLIRILADPEDDTLPPPPPMLKGGSFPIEDLLLEQVHSRERRRVREAFVLSVLANVFVLLILLFGARIFPSLTIRPVVEEKQVPPPQLTFLEMPPDLITKAKPTQPKALSDRDRHFQHDDKITNSLSVPRARPAPQPRPAAPPPGRVAPTERPAPPRPSVLAAGPPRPKPEPNSAAKTGGKPGPEAGQLQLQNVPQPKPRQGLQFDLNPANSLQRAIEGAVRDGSRGQQAVTEVAPLPRQPSGSGSAAPGQTGAGVQILTDTQGVDFSSYLRRIVEIVRRNWYAVMPETVYLGTKGRVVIIFNINTNGTVPGLRPVSLSGTASLDQAAEASIHASNPFPPLPSAFHGPSITLQFSFYYNITPPGQ